MPGYESRLYRYIGDVEGMPPGPTWQCSVCGALIRTGEPHSAREPRPHATLETLYERLEDE